MSERGNDHEATSGTVFDTVRPWQTLASLGITEDDLTAVHHRPSAHRFPSDRAVNAAVTSLHGGP
ncbi:hypothetical protein ACFSL4_06035 [Streptomyces caeni]|uniref:Uncharacterized protein n=1 Tax=Streptomyces caeni TaxID=2307231 RepID=A0ABW4INP0_9ACTN